MPLAAVAMDLPADVAAVHAGDLDGDGRAELVFVSHAPQQSRPDAVTLAVVSVSDSGQGTVTQRIPLGDTPMLWDIHNGLWGVDADGARDLLTGERVVSQATMLALLGPTTPRSADIADDFDNNGITELLLPTRGALRVFTTDGEAVGSLAATATGELSTRGHSGGTMIVASSMVPATVIGDLDGDGLKDILMPDGARAVGWRTTDRAGGERLAMRLPLDLAPDEGPDRPDVRLARSWFTDLDGDGRLDLATHHWVTSGTWFGSTARLTAYTGTGAGWQERQTMSTTRAAFEVQMLDFDSDGDQDIFVAEVDVGLGNIGRALLARSVQVELGVYAMENGRYPDTPRPIRTLSWPIENPEAVLLSMEGDLDGDGWLDLVTNDAGAQLRVYRGSASGLATSPTASLGIGDARRGDQLMVRDLTGDGRAEVLLWREGAAQARILQLRP